MRRCVSGLVLAVVSVLLPALVSPPAQATTDTKLPFGRYSGMVVDQAHGHVFVSGNATGGHVLVTDLAGRPIKDISGLPKVGPVHLATDGSRAVLVAGTTVVQIDTATLAATSTVLPGSVCPRDVVDVGGELWLGYGCSHSGAIGVLDPDTATVTAAATAHELWEAPLLESSPGLGQALVTIDPTATEITLMDLVGGDSPSAADRGTIPFDNGQTDPDVQVSPDGSRLVVSAQQFRYYRTSDLTLVKSRTSTGGPAATAWRDDGWIAEGDNGNGSTIAAKITLREPGGEIFRSYRLRAYDASQGLDAQYILDLAFGKVRLYAVIQDGYGRNLLRVITPRLASAVGVSTDKWLFDYGGSVHVKAHLAPGTTSRILRIYATPYRGVRKLLVKGQVDAHGDLRVQYVVRRATRFEAVYAGDATHDPSSARRGVRVRSTTDNWLLGGTRGSDGVRHYAAGTRARMVGEVKHSMPGSCLYIGVQWKFGGEWQPYGGTDCLRMNDKKQATGTLSGVGLAGRQLRMRAEWSGDLGYEGSVGPWRYLRFG